LKMGWEWSGKGQEVKMVMCVTVTVDDFRQETMGSGELEPIIRICQRNRAAEMAPRALILLGCKEARPRGKAARREGGGACDGVFRRSAQLPLILIDLLQLIHRTPLQICMREGAGGVWGWRGTGRGRAVGAKVASEGVERRIKYQ
jgi:hypothetical protein